MRLIPKCDWYESDKKSNKFFLKLEKTRASQGLIRTLVKNEKEINDPVETNTELQDFYKKLFSDNLSISKQNVVSLFENLTEPKLQEEQVIKWESEITESEMKMINLRVMMTSQKSFMKPFRKKLKPLFPI